MVSAIKRPDLGATFAKGAPPMVGPLGDFTHGYYDRYTPHSRRG